MRSLQAFVAITASTALTACGNTGQINDALSGTPKALRDCNELALEVLLASYEKAGENQGRLTSFVSPIKLNRVEFPFYYYDIVKLALNSDGEIVKTALEPSPLGYDLKVDLSDGASDYRIQSKGKDSITCGITFEGEGDVSGWGYTISRDSNSIYWRKN